MTALRSPAHNAHLDEIDHIVRLHDVSWSDYLRILRMRGDRSAPRICYLEGEVEIISPGRNHETIKSLIGCLVEVYCLENDIEFTPVGSWTLKNKAKQRGAEPDECYVFGEGRDPNRPDLAIEVVWTHGRIDKLEIYRKLGVREIWYFRDGVIDPFVLRGERYVRVAKSKALPGIDLAEIAGLLDHTIASRAIRAYRAALQKRARKR